MTYVVTKTTTFVVHFACGYCNLLYCHISLTFSCQLSCSRLSQILVEFLVHIKYVHVIYSHKNIIMLGPLLQQDSVFKRKDVVWKISSLMPVIARGSLPMLSSHNINIRLGYCISFYYEDLYSPEQSIPVA